MRLIVVRAEWDEEAQVWYSANPEIGLFTEAQSVDDLRRRILNVLPDIFAESGEQAEEVAVELIAHASDRLTLAAA